MAKTSDATGRNPLPLIVLIVCFAVAMCAGVVAILAWKAAEARSVTVQREQIDTQNLVHSLSRHAVNSIQAADMAITGVVELLRFQNPLSERMQPFLEGRVKALPQLREIVVLRPDGSWRYSSLPELATYSNADRSYFQYHKDAVDSGLRITELISRRSGRPSILLTKRITLQDGSFGGVVVATIDSEYFTGFYRSFKLGESGSITLLSADGQLLLRWPEWTRQKDLSKTELFSRRLKESPSGFYRFTSTFDGIDKYFGFEMAAEYPIVVTVAASEKEMLAGWSDDLRKDIVVALCFIAAIVLLAALIVGQVAARSRMIQQLRERERRYRLLADNMADIVVLLDRNARIIYVSPSVESIGFGPVQLIGTSCLDLVHPEDVERLQRASSELAAGQASKTAVFRCRKAENTYVWLEAHFRHGERDHKGQLETVAILRDVTERRKMERELQTLNRQLTHLATTDGLTGLANRRTFDLYLEEEFAGAAETALLLIDIDNFKAFNDNLGHQAGDRCLATVADVIADATLNTNGLSARYGGEEFVVVLPGVSEQDALKIATAIRLAVRARNVKHPGASRGFVSVSIGVASKRQSASNPRALVADADMALYHAKDSGRNCVVCASTLQSHAIDDAETATGPRAG